MNRRSKSSLPFISASGKNALGNSMQQFNTHDHFHNLIYLSVKSHILENTASLASGWVGSESGNTMSLYLDAIFFAVNCSTDPLVDDFAWFYIYLIFLLRQLLRNYWYVPSLIHTFQPNINWWHWAIFNNCGGISNQW